MLGEPEAEQVLQVRTDLGCHKRTCRDKEILTEHRLTPLQIPVGMLQLILVKIREQTPVIIEYRTHGNWVHRFRIKQNTEIAVMTVGIENQRVQNAHPAEVFSTVKFLEVIKKNRDRTLALEDACCLCKALVFGGKQTAFTDKLTTVEIQVVVHVTGTQNGCELCCQELRQRLYFKTAAAGLIKEDVLPFSDPTFSVIAVGTKLRRSR